MILERKKDVLPKKNKLNSNRYPSTHIRGIRIYQSIGSGPPTCALTLRKTDKRQEDPFEHLAHADSVTKTIVHQMLYT